MHTNSDSDAYTETTYHEDVKVLNQIKDLLNLFSKLQE
jgi:hypothetical protein